MAVGTLDRIFILGMILAVIITWTTSKPVVLDNVTDTSGNFADLLGMDNEWVINSSVPSVSSMNNDQNTVDPTPEDRNETSEATNETADQWVVQRYDEFKFKGFGTMFKAAARSAKSFGKAAMKGLRVAGKKLAKFGPKAMKQIGKGFKKGYAMAQDLANDFLHYAPQVINTYMDFQNARAPQEQEPVEEAPGEPDNGGGEEEQGWRHQASNDHGRPGKVFDQQPKTGISPWVYGVVAVVVIVGIGGIVAFMYLGGETDFRRRRKKHRERKRRGESESSTASKEQQTATEATTEATQTVAPSAVSGRTVADQTTAATATVTEATTTVQKKTKKGKKKRTGLGKTLYRIEKSLYAQPKKGKGKGKAKGKGKGKKKGAAKTEPTTMTSAVETTAATEATQTVTEVKTKPKKSGKKKRK